MAHVIVMRRHYPGEHREKAMANDSDRLATLGRRDFLRLCGGAALLGAGGSASMGCGGGGSGNDGSHITPEQRTAALNDVSARIAALPRVDRAADNQQLAKYLTGHPAFSAAGVSDTSCVWGTFKDGRHFIFFNNRVLDDGPSKAARRATRVAGNSIPASTVAQLIAWFWGVKDNHATPFIAALLQPNGYDTKPNVTKPYVTGTIEELMNLPANIGFLRWGTHGGSYPNPSPFGGKDVFALMTATEVTVENDTKYGPMLLAEDLTYGIGEDITETGITKQRCCYVATAGFFTNSYWKHKFAPDSLVMLSACFSHQMDDIKKAMFASGASAICGWTDVTGSFGMSEAEKMAVDLMLGAKTIVAPAKNPIPMDYERVKAELEKQGLSPVRYTEPKTEANPNPKTYVAFLEFTRNANTQFAQLAPSISTVTPKSNDTFTITGTFGPDPGARGKVTVDQEQVDIIAWSNTSIDCKLPLLGGGGSVVVSVDGRKSNAMELVFGLDHIDITPSSILGMNDGETRQLTANPKDKNGNAASGNYQFRWSSNDVVTLDPIIGNVTNVTAWFRGSGVGHVTVTETASGISQEALVYVQTGPF